MAKQVCAGAKLQCSFGASPASLKVTDHKVKTGGKAAANIMDHQPDQNIPAFGQCSCIANPEVASATAGNQGVLTPAACMPQTMTPWENGAAKTMVGGQPALTAQSTINCAYGGMITITDPGQETVDKN